MKVVRGAVVCSLWLGCAALVSSSAWAQQNSAAQSQAQSDPSRATAPQSAQASAPEHHAWWHHDDADARTHNPNSCVGPTSFCNLYFGG